MIPSHWAAAYSLDLVHDNGSCLQLSKDSSDPIQENSDGKNGREGRSMNVPTELEYSEYKNINNAWIIIITETISYMKIITNNS